MIGSVKTAKKAVSAIDTGLNPCYNILLHTEKGGRMKYIIRQYQYREIEVEADSEDLAVNQAALLPDEDWDYSDFSDDQVEVAE